MRSSPNITLMFVALAGCFTAMSIAPAHADWQYVKWGMTKKAAINASKGEARTLKSGEDIACAFTTQIPFATIPKKSLGGFDFQVTLCTEGADKVTSVALSPVRETNLPTLRRSLISQYGQPTIVSGTSIWNDKKTGNTVSFYDIGGVVGRIEYKNSARLDCNHLKAFRSSRLPSL